MNREWDVSWILLILVASTMFPDWAIAIGGSLAGVALVIGVVMAILYFMTSTDD